MYHFYNSGILFKTLIISLLFLLLECALTLKAPGLTPVYKIGLALYFCDQKYNNKIYVSPELPSSVTALNNTLL